MDSHHATIRLRQPNDVRPPLRIVYGVPTVGKSHTQRLLIAAGFECFDTDDLYASNWPSFAERRGWRNQSNEERDDQHSTIGHQVATTLADRPGSVYFTNLWSTAFRSQVADFLPADGLFPIGWFRRDVDLMVELQLARDGNVTPDAALAIAQRVARAEAIDVVHHAIVLGRGQYMSDSFLIVSK